MTSFNCWRIGEDASFAVLSSQDKTVNELKATIIAQDPDLQKFSPGKVKLFLANIKDFANFTVLVKAPSSLSRKEITICHDPTTW